MTGTLSAGRRLLDFKGQPGLERWEEPEELLRHLGVETPEGIDVEAICYYCRAPIIYRRMRGCEARIVSFRGTAVIVVNEASHPFRQRFSAAHELAHWMLDSRDQAHSVTGEQYRESEGRADRWAADLLMPASMFTADAEGRDVTFDTVRDLARRYRTSLTATALRLVRLGSFPSMLVCSRRAERWKWFYRGPGVPQEMWPRDQPGPGTSAHELLRGRRVSSGPRIVGAEGWLERKDAWWFEISEDSVAVQRGEVLSLLWWRELGQLKASLAPGATWLPWSPGRNARRRLAGTLCAKWGYRRRRVRGEMVLETEEPSPHRLVLPALGELGVEKVRGFVSEVARHKGVERGAVLLSMLALPEGWTAEDLEGYRRAAMATREGLPWLGEWLDEVKDYFAG